MTEETRSTLRDFELVFGESKTEERTETISLEGMKPLEITFEVPDRLARMDMALGVVADGQTDPDKVSKAKAMLTFCARWLRGWDLWAEKKAPPPPNYEMLLALADKHMDVVFAIYATIHGAGADAKN